MLCYLATVVAIGRRLSFPSSTGRVYVAEDDSIELLVDLRELGSGGSALSREPSGDKWKGDPEHTRLLVRPVAYTLDDGEI